MATRKDWQRYNDIKLLVENYWQLQEGKRYEDFMRKLLHVLDL